MNRKILIGSLTALLIGTLAVPIGLQAKPSPLSALGVKASQLAPVERPQTPEVTKANTICPVSGMKADPNEIVTYHGKEVRLCCAKCEEAFRSNPAKYMDKGKESSPARHWNKFHL